MKAEKTMIRLDNAALGYAQHTVVSDVSISISAGSLTAITGANGEGKTTFLNTVVGFQSVLQGKLEINLPVSSVGYLPQNSGVDCRFPFSLFDFVSTGLWHRVGPQRAIRRDSRDAIKLALRQTGLSSMTGAPLGMLSGGQWQRARFARLILQDSPLILLDEPFASIDEHTTADLLNIIHHWHAQGRTILAVLHDRRQILQHFPQSLLFEQGKVIHGESQILLALAEAPRRIA